MHYFSTAFSRNGLPTIEALQSGVTIGQQLNLSTSDVQAVRILYNCTTNGATLPPTTTPNTGNLSSVSQTYPGSLTLSRRIQLRLGCEERKTVYHPLPLAFLNTVNTTYASAWTTTSPSFSRYNGVAGNYYYEAIQVTVSTSGYYRFRSTSAIDSYGYLYTDSFLSSTPSMNVYTQDDDGAGSAQFQFTVVLQPGVVYILVATSYFPNIRAPFTVVVSGLVRVNLVRLGNSTSIPSTTTIPTTPSTSSSESFRVFHYFFSSSVLNVFMAFLSH